jgi:hypothetical protein
MCSRLLEVLISLEDKYATENFQQLRMEAMVSLAVTMPALIIPYEPTRFCKFYSRHQTFVLVVSFHTLPAAATSRYVSGVCSKRS